MRGALTGLAVILMAAGGNACTSEGERVAGPDPGLAQLVSPARAIVTGSGHYLEPVANQFRTFSFAALEMPDGTVQGRFSGGVHGGGRINHWSGRVVCLEIDGHVAWIGAIYEHTPINPALEGRGFMFKVVDHGEGQAAAPDSISRAMRGLGVACETRPEPALFYEVIAGNVQIHP